MCLKINDGPQKYKCVIFHNFTPIGINPDNAAVIYFEEMHGDSTRNVDLSTQKEKLHLILNIQTVAYPNYYCFFLFFTFFSYAMRGVYNYLRLYRSNPKVNNVVPCRITPFVRNLSNANVHGNLPQFGCGC